jgi:hypothetical protein
MNKFLVVLLALSGCASLGQYAYKGPAKGVVISEHIISMPMAPTHGGMASGGHVFDYWNSPVNKTVEVSNGSDQEQTVVVYCNYIQFSGNMDVTVPAHKTQEILVTTIAKYAYDTLCTLPNN